MDLRLETDRGAMHRMREAMKAGRGLYAIPAREARGVMSEVRRLRSGVKGLIH